MLAKLLIHFLFFEFAVTQFDGNFWWLNNKLDRYGRKPSPPQFEELTEFDTDESAKIVFVDSDYSFPPRDFSKSDKEIERKNKALENNKLKIDIHFQDKSAIAWPDYNKQSNALALQEIKNNTMKEQGSNKSSTVEDILEFKFPNDDDFWHIKKGDKFTPLTASTTETSTKNNQHNKVVLINDKKPLKVHEQNGETESICTSMKKIECNRRGGVVYSKHGRDLKKLPFEAQTVCCILPIQDESQSRIYFPGMAIGNKRIRRSNAESPGLKQRNALLLRKYGPQRLQALATKANIANKKVVTPEYDDPYWNIKNSNFKNPHHTKLSTTKYDYDSYEEDYVVEVPQPGLVGLYSDNPASPPNWSFVGTKPNFPYGGFIESEEDGGTSFLYPGTIDPRLVDRLGASKPIRSRPVKFSISSNEKYFNAESHTISYQSNPDFNVMQGYKLLNLVRNKTTTTTESVYDDDSKNKEDTVLIASSFETGYDNSDDDHQSYKDCGRVSTETTDYNDDTGEKQIGEAEVGSHPWLSIIVLTRRRQSILCYSTIITQTVAITAADCVYGKSTPGAVTLIAGVWDLGDTTHEGWQKRLVSMHLHPLYRPGDLAHDLAILHWKRPLTFNERVQPACLSDPHVSDDCKFYGWGGYDQAIRQRSRWQRATILTYRACSDKISPSKRADLPRNSFCAAVHSRGTVTGMGGPLMCSVGERQSAVGVAVWRDNAVVLIPVNDWAMQAVAKLDL